MFERPLLISNVKDLKLDYNNAGVQDYWKDILQELEERPTGGILLKSIDDAVAGTYSNQYSIDCITFNKKHVKYDNMRHVLKLSELGVQTLLHEGAHFLHIGVAHGKYIAPCYKNCKPFDMNDTIDQLNAETGRTNRYMCEFEAGYRAVVSAVTYDTGLEERVAADNLRNLLNYAKKRQNWLDKLIKAIDNNEKLTETCEQFILDVCLDYMKDKKFIDIEDINSVKIKLTNEQSDMLKQICK